MSRIAPRTSDEAYEAHDPNLEAPSQRQHRPPALSPLSRHSSSTGSTRTLRRTRRLPLRSIASNRPLLSPLPANGSSRRPAQTFPSSQTDSRQSSGSPEATVQIFRSSSYWPKRSTRISKRTAEAVLYALEAIRGDPQGRLGSPEASPSGRSLQQWKPRSFTRNLAEENASMSDLLGGAMSGRSQNGGGLGPVPVPRQPGGETGSVTPPTEIMQRRRAREAARREENRLQQQRQQQQGEEQQQQRRPQVESERRPEQTRVDVDDAGAVPPSNQRRSRIRTRGDSLSQGVSSEQRQTERDSGLVRGIPDTIASIRQERARLSSGALDPTGVESQTRTRRRGATVSQDQPRPVEPARASRVVSGPPQATFTSQSTGLPSGSQQPQTEQSGVPPRTADQTPKSAASSFPHAFERWEQLSSHWEGLTSYWIHRLEQNKEDLEREPLNQQMARQVTDLSAAGANLFHAVVELQRLRASSERKFQRWFLETRAEQERARENQARLEQQLQAEIQARTQSATNSARYDNEIKAAYAAKAMADVQVKEMRRELVISKDEARRAWEELGRRAVEERDRTASLKAGHITLVGGVQVVPTAEDRASRAGIPSSRGSQAVPQQPGYTSYDTARSETDTDPFTEAARSTADQFPMPASTMYQQTQTSHSSAAALQATQGATTSSGGPQGVRMPTTTAASSSIPHTNGNGAVSNPPGAFYQQAGATVNPDNRPVSAPEVDDRSYVPSAASTISQDEYELDSHGHVRRDSTGQPILARRGPASEDSDEYNVREQLERERALGQTYGSTGASGTTGAQTATAGEQDTDYEGRGYGTWEAAPRHHHPTRLSDVMEEDERSRTSPSRASQSSRGIR